MVTPANHLISGRDLQCTGPLVFWGYYNIFLPNIDPKKVLPPERGAPGTVPYGKFGPGICITFLKRLDKGPEVATFKTNTLNLYI